MHITQAEKEKFLLSFDEDNFRDRVVRRLFKSLGFQDGRDTCGPEEMGRDAVFVEHDRLGDQVFIGLQTKVGSISLAGDPAKNLHTLVAQLRTALAQHHVCVRTKARKLPSTVYLAASGRINNQAREYIASQLSDPRMKFLDRDDLITKIDEKCPEIWSGIVSDVSPYLKALASKVDELNVAGVDANPVQSSIGAFVAASDVRYVEVRLGYHEPKVEKVSGQIKDTFDYVEVRGSELFSKGSVRALLLGDAGSGKTTLLVRLAYMLAKSAVVSTKSYRVPVFVRAHEVVGFGENVFEDLSKTTVTNHGLAATPFSVDDLERGRVVLLVDGLDELSESEDRQKVINFCGRFSDSYPLCSLAIATRPYSSIDQLLGMQRFKRYRISPLSVEDASRMLAQIESKTTEHGKEWRQEVLRKLEGVHGVELNPLLVTVFAVSAGYDKKDIPANITELFSKFTELMLGRWDEKKGLGQQYQSRIKDKLVSEFAFSLHKRGDSTFSRSEFHAFASGRLGEMNLGADADIVVSEIVDRSGLLRGHNDLEFRHHLLQEFFAAKGIPSSEFVKTVVGDEWWRNACVFYFGANPDSVQSLLDVATSGVSSGANAFITVGLALQACYMSNIEDRIEVWKWVNGAACEMIEKWLAADWSEEKYPVTSFIAVYLEAKEAVPLVGIEDRKFGIEEWCSNSSATPAEEELRRFWFSVGLSELGEFTALRRVLEPKPLASALLTMAIHFSCFFAEKRRALPASNLRDAQELDLILAPRVAHLRQQVTKEFKGQLLEYRRGGVVALDAQEPSASE